MVPPTIHVAAFLTAVVTTGSVLAAQVEMFPPGPHVAHCRALNDNPLAGGDDDHNNVYFFEVDPLLAGGTPAPDFFIFLWDGDNNATSALNGRQDWDRNGTPGFAPFEYRLYGGPGAATNDEATPGQNPSSYTGTLIDIDSDPNDNTLRTDDPDDNDNNSPEDLRDQGLTTIAIDIDANPGDLIGGRHIYKFVVDGSEGPGGDWNRYKIQIARDITRLDSSGTALYVHELTYAGRPGTAPVWTYLGFRVPVTRDQRIDIQTLDMDAQGAPAQAELTTHTQVFTGNQTYESGEQLIGNQWQWTSLNQQVPFPTGNAVTGQTYDTTGQEGLQWTLDIDPGFAHKNPFSVRLMASDGTTMLPIRFEPAFSAYGTGPLILAGRGLPKAGGSPITLIGAQAPPLSPGVIFVSATQTNVPFPPLGVTLYVNLADSGAIPVTFDATGVFNQVITVPNGIATVDVFAQTFAVVLASGKFLHSNGLEISIVP